MLCALRLHYGMVASYVTVSFSKLQGGRCHREKFFFFFFLFLLAGLSAPHSCSLERSLPTGKLIPHVETLANVSQVLSLTVPKTDHSASERMSNECQMIDVCVCVWSIISKDIRLSREENNTSRTDSSVKTNRSVE